MEYMAESTQYMAERTTHISHKQVERAKALQLFSCSALGSWQQKAAGNKNKQKSSAVACRLQQHRKGIRKYRVCVCACKDRRQLKSQQQTNIIYKCSKGCTAENKVIKTCSEYVENVTKDSKNRKEENLKEHFYDN